MLQKWYMACGVFLVMFYLSVSGAHGTSAVPEESVKEFVVLRQTLFQLRDQILSQDELFGKNVTEKQYMRPEIRAQIRGYWYTLADIYLSLDTLSASMGEIDNGQQEKGHQGFELVRGIFLTQYRVALELIPVFERQKALGVIFNEGDAALGLQSGLYDEFKYQYLNVIKAGKYAALEALAGFYGKPENGDMARWAKEDSAVILAAGKGPGPELTLENGFAILRKAGERAWFPAQKGVATWMGKTKVWRQGKSLISMQQIDALEGRLEPGDILLERREWYMTNVGIPGFWTHAALYIGNAEQRLKFSRREGVRQWLKQQGAEDIDGLIARRYPQTFAVLQQPTEEGRLPSVIESIGAGVSLTSLVHTASCDSIAVLRPRLEARDRGAAVVRAMMYQGRPYDYNFDFLDDTSLVCTELVVKAYLPGDGKVGVNFPLQRHMGRIITPANAFARQFDEDYNSPRSQFDLIVFLDGDEQKGDAVQASEQIFRSSWNRPKWHILVPQHDNSGEEKR